MASRTDIANLALTRLEVETVDNIDTADGLAARTLKRAWDVQRDLALAAHPWNFATTWWRNLPAKPADQNPSPYHARAFDKPNDCLRVLRIGVDPRRGERFKVAEGLIVTNAAAPLTIYGIKRITDPGRYDTWFVEYFSARLAWTCGKPLNASEALRQAAKQDALRILSDAQSLDGQEGDPPQIFQDSFLEAREGGDWLE